MYHTSVDNLYSGRRMLTLLVLWLFMVPTEQPLHTQTVSLTKACLSVWPMSPSLPQPPDAGIVTPRNLLYVKSLLTSSLNFRKIHGIVCAYGTNIRLNDDELAVLWGMPQQPIYESDQRCVIHWLFTADVEENPWALRYYLSTYGSGGWHSYTINSVPIIILRPAAHRTLDVVEMI